jgi:ClpP class serine protease
MSTAAYAEWLEEQEKIAPPLLRDAVDPEEDGKDDIDDEEDSEETEEKSSASTSQNPPTHAVAPPGNTDTKFKRTGLLAIESKAMDTDWVFADPHQQFPDLSDPRAAVVTIRGPLVHHPDVRFDSYDNLIGRIRAAFESTASKVLLSIDSPGGEVSGCFDTAAEIVKLKAEHGDKPIDCYIDGQASSAAFALACACDRIIIPQEGVAGSIGVFAQIESKHRLIKSMGIDVEMVASGDRKLDGNPMVPITKDALENIREGVMQQAGVFWGWVASRRPISIELIRGLEGKSYHGIQAVHQKLADHVGTFSEALAMVADTSGKSQAVKSGKAQGAEMSHLRKMLLDEAAEDNESGRKAKRALEAYDKPEEGEPKEPPEHDEPDGDENRKAEEGAEARRKAETDEDAKRSADSRRASHAEDDSEEAKRAEGEEDEARRAEDEARRAEDDASEEDAKAMRASDAKTIQAHVARSVLLRARASDFKAKAYTCRKNAGLYRSMARSNALSRQAIDASKKALARVATGPALPVASAASQGTRGAAPTQTSSQIDASAPDLNIFTAKELRALGLASTNSNVVEFEGRQELGLLTPQAAEQIVKATQARVAEMRGNK